LRRRSGRPVRLPTTTLYKSVVSCCVSGAVCSSLLVKCKLVI